MQKNIFTKPVILSRLISICIGLLSRYILTLCGIDILNEVLELTKKGITYTITMVAQKVFIKHIFVWHFESPQPLGGVPQPLGGQTNNMDLSSILNTPSPTGSPQTVPRASGSANQASTTIAESSTAGGQSFNGGPPSDFSKSVKVNKIERGQLLVDDNRHRFLTSKFCKETKGVNNTVGDLSPFEKKNWGAPLLRALRAAEIIPQSGSTDEKFKQQIQRSKGVLFEDALNQDMLKRVYEEITNEEMRLLKNRPDKVPLLHAAALALLNVSLKVTIVQLIKLTMIFIK
jgi:hypothetical protein